MINRFDAILALVGGGVSGCTDGRDIKYHDGQTPPSEAEIDAKLAELQAEYDAQEYARNRAVAYPSFAEQFDLLYHKGVTGLKAELKKTKDKYPKPSE